MFLFYPFFNFVGKMSLYTCPIRVHEGWDKYYTNQLAHATCTNTSAYIRRNNADVNIFVSKCPFLSVYNNRDMVLIVFI